MTIKTVTLPDALVAKLEEHYKKLMKNRSKIIRYGLGDFLLLPYSEQKLDDVAITEVLTTIEEEQTCSKISVRIPCDLLTVIEKLTENETTMSETITNMLARILYLPLEDIKYEKALSLLTVMGNKWNRKIQTAIKCIEETKETDWKCSVETCVGGLGIFSNFKFSQEQVLNDNDWNKINLLKVIKGNPRELIAKARAFEVSQETFDKLKETPTFPIKSNCVDAAARYLYLNICSCRGGCTHLRKGVTDRSYYKRLSAIYFLHQKLQDTKIYDGDIFDILNKFRKTDNTLFIIDPPYLNTKGYENRTTRNEPSYGKGFALEQHKKLEKLLHCIKENNGNDFIYFCRITATRHKNQKDKKCKNTDEELKILDKKLQRQVDRLYYGFGYYYLDVQTLDDGTVERIITSFNFKGAQPYGQGRRQK